MVHFRQEERRTGRRAPGARPRSPVRPRTLVVLPRPTAPAGRALVVIQDEAARRRVAAALSASGVEVVETRAAQEALERAGGADLALVDLGLLGSSVPFLIEDLLRAVPGLYVVLLGGGPDEARLGYRAGADNWARATTTPVELARLVLRSLGPARAKRERAGPPPRRRLFSRSALWVSLAGAVAGGLLAWAVSSLLSWQEAEDARTERFLRALEQPPKPPPIPPAAPAK